MLLFSWFERRLDPFPAAEPVEPPKTLVAFCLHYTRGAWPYILVDAVLVTAAQSYVASTFAITDAGGRALALHQCGIKQTGDLLWVCAEAAAPKGIGALRVLNRMLCELYSDQVNIVQSNDRGTKRSILFTRGDGTKPLR